MHDWTMLSILFEWKTASVTVSLQTPKSDVVEIIAREVSDLHVPQMKEWGPSVSVNQLRGPVSLEKGKFNLEIEMQSGDVISIEASEFKFPQSIIMNE